MKAILQFSKILSAAVLVAALCTSPLVAQQTSIRLIDVSKVYENYGPFVQQRDQLQQQVKNYENQLIQQQQEFQRLNEDLKTKDPNSSEFQQLERNLAQQGTNLEINKRAQLRRFAQAEAKMHFDTYVQVCQEIARFCAEQQVQLVLQYSSTDMKQDDPQSIMQRVNSKVVFHSPRNDITDAIIQRLQQRVAAGNSGAQNNR